VEYQPRVQPRFFTTPAQLRRWLARHHARAPGPGGFPQASHRARQHLQHGEHGQGAALTAAGRMRAAGRAAFASRTANRSGRYSYARPGRLVASYAGMLQRNRPAPAFFNARTPSYRRAAPGGR